MALYNDIDFSLTVFIINRLALIGLGQLDLSTSLLLERLDCGTTLADDECSAGLRNGNLDGNL